MSRGKQRYKCLACLSVFIPKDTSWIRTSYVDYSLHKQTHRERKNRNTVQKYLTRSIHYTWELPILRETERMCVVIDATYFSSRTDGMALIRSNTKLNLIYDFVSSESLTSMSKLMSTFDSAGYVQNTDAFTIDGRRFMFDLLKKRYPTIPVQMCIFHMKAIIRRYTTLRPKTRLGKALKILKSILWHIPEKMFLRIFTEVESIYVNFLKERNTSGQYEHKRLRSAMASIRYYLPYLHTYEKYSHISIPRTTGICDGYFSHVKEKLKPHRWISRIQRDSLLIFLLEEQNRKERT